MARLGPTGLTQVFTDIKNWVNSKLSTKADTAHTHTTYAVKHAYTTAANAAKNWYRIANANTKQVYTGNPIHAEFILTAYNSSYDPGYSERWYVRAMVLGRNAYVVIFGGNTAPFSQCRVLYENTVADIDDNDRPAIDIYLNYVLANGTTKIEIEEVYNQGWTFVADGQLAASTVPTGFENVAVSIRNNGVERSTYSDIATYLNKPRRDITSNVTLADNNTYRSTTLNCTGTRTITLPSINSNYFWCVIKNFNAEAGIITIHPSTTAVLIDGSNDDIILRPGEFVTIHSRAANSYSIVGDNRKRTCLVGRSGEVGTDTKHWFRVAQKTIRTTYKDAFILFDVFQIGADSTYMGRLCAHVRVDGTVGVVGNKQFNWLYRGTQLSDDDFAMTTIETSGTSVVVDIWCKRTGGYSAFAFAVVSEGFSTDSLDSPAGKWILTRERATVGDLESLDTGFTTVTNPSVVTLANSITGNAGSATTAQQVRKDPAAGSTADLLYSQCAGTDIFRLQVGGASNAGYAEIATADDGSEPIYVRQYKGTFTSLQRTATLLDGSGNTSFPGQVTGVTFNGPLTWGGTAFSYNAGNSLYFYSGQPAIANCFEGSSNDFTKFSYPTGGTSVSSSNANIQTLRLDWGNTYWHDLFMSPNNNYLWHRNVVNSDARGWRRIVEENVTGLTDQSWNINIAGNAATVTGTAGTSTLAWGSEVTLYTVGGNAIKAKLPANPNSDTKNTAGSTDSSSKLFLIGATTQEANPQTYSHDTAYVGTDGCLYSGGAKVLTAHQSLANYVDLSSTQTITGKKLFTNSAIQLDNVTSMSGSTMFIDTSAAAPRGAFPAEDHRVGRIYIGDNTSYNGAWFIVDPTITTNKAYYRMVTTNPDNTDSTRFSIMWDGTETGARCRKNVSTGDLLPYANNTYNLGADDHKWDIGYIHNLIGSNKEDKTEDVNSYYSTTSGSHMTFYTTSNGGTKLSNVPAAVNTHLESRTIRYLSSSDWIIEQICHNSFGLYYRKGTNGTWEDWKTFAFTNSNITGTAANVTGTVAIANGGTGATTRLNAVKNLTNESVASPTHFLTITTNYAKAGYTTVAQAKTALGITGDIVSHNSSEFLTTSGNETVTGTKIFNGDKIVITQGNGYRMVCNTDGGSSGYGIFQRVDSANWYLMVTAQNDALGSWTSARPASMNLSTGVLSINGNAETATQFSANKSVTLTGDVTGTTSSKAGWSVATTLANSGVTAGTYGPSEDVTGNNNTTISVPQITVDAKGRVTSVTNRTYTSVNTDTNTDTKVTQTVTNDNACYPLLIANTASASHTGLEPTTETDEVRKAYNINVQARYGFIYARNSYNHDNLKGSVAGGNRTSAAFYGSTYDGATVGGVELGRVDKYGNRYSRLYATNHITDGALAPDGTAVAATFDVGVLADGTKYLNTSAGWYCNVYPTLDNTRTLGTSSLRWKECYSNAYYLGTTAFGDIVTHNASEFLTSHQSLSSCVKNVVTNSQTIKSTGITRGTAPSSAQTFGIPFIDNNGTYIGNVYGVFATNMSTFVGLYAYKGTTTSNGDNASVRVGYDASGNAYTYAPTPATTDNSTQIATTAFVKAQGYLTAHQSLANYVTTNTNQSISGIKSHSKHISILGDYIGNEFSTNARTCLYLKSNRDTDGQSGIYFSKYRQNVAQGALTGSNLVSLTLDVLENSVRTNNCISIHFRYFENDVPTKIYVIPKESVTSYMGTADNPWTNAYAVNIYENGTALSSKYALNENFGKGTTTYLYIKAEDFPTGSGSSKSIQYNDVIDGTKLYVWHSVCNSSSILDITPAPAKVTGTTGQVWRYLGTRIYAAGLGHDSASPTGILGLFRRES